MNHAADPLTYVNSANPPPEFRWNLPERFNIGTAVSDVWAAKAPDSICLQHYRPGELPLQMTYGELAKQSDAFAHALASLGVAPGDRVAILLPQGFDTVIAHLAIYKLGAIALPLALLFGGEALQYRLGDAGAVAIVTNDFGLSKVGPLQKDLPQLRSIILSGAETGDPRSMAALIAAHPKPFQAIDSGPDDPALMIYTSGTTGPPKGALHGHRVLLGHIPGMKQAHENMPQPGDKVWTPSDWAWAGGLLNALLPALYMGVPVVSSAAQKFDPHVAFQLMAEMGVRNAFIPPTALRLMRSVKDPLSTYALNLRTIGSAGESLGRETFEWAKSALGMRVNEFYGQTECNFVLSNAAAFGISKAGSMGKPVPGHVVAVVDESGQPLPAGSTGQVAIRRPDPVMFLSYWNNDAATEAKFIGDWMLTGDQGRMDENGYINFFGRDDDVITSSGYRIGPGEVEDCLLGHDAVQLAAVIGKPDAVRTEVVKAFVVLAEGHTASPELAFELSNWVKHRLSMHEYPREVAFVDSLPMTTTGKIIRRLLRDQESGISAVSST